MNLLEEHKKSQEDPRNLKGGVQRNFSLGQKKKGGGGGGGGEGSNHLFGSICIGNKQNLLKKGADPLQKIQKCGDTKKNHN